MVFLFWKTDIYNSIQTQNWLNLINLLATVAISIGGSIINHQFSHSKSRNNDPIKITLESTSRIYLGYTTFYMSTVILVTRAKTLESINAINFALGVFMMLLYASNLLWVHNYTTDKKIMRRIRNNLCTNIIIKDRHGESQSIRECDYYNCSEEGCKREWSALQIVRLCKGIFIFAYIMLIINIIVSLSPITRP